MNFNWIFYIIAFIIAVLFFPSLDFDFWTWAIILIAFAIGYDMGKEDILKSMKTKRTKKK